MTSECRVKRVVCKTWTGTLTNSAEPDQTPQNAASDQRLHCLVIKYRKFSVNWNSLKSAFRIILSSLHSETVELSVLSVLWFYMLLLIMVAYFRVLNSCHSACRGKIYSRQYFEIFIFFFFSEKGFYITDNLHDLSKPIFWEKKENYFKMSSAELAQRVLNFKSEHLTFQYDHEECIINCGILNQLAL